MESPWILRTDNRPVFKLIQGVCTLSCQMETVDECWHSKNKDNQRLEELYFASPIPSLIGAIELSLYGISEREQIFLFIHQNLINI